MDQCLGPAALVECCDFVNFPRDKVPTGQTLIRQAL